MSVNNFRTIEKPIAAQLDTEVFSKLIKNSVQASMRDAFKFDECSNIRVEFSGTSSTTGAVKLLS